MRIHIRLRSLLSAALAGWVLLCALCSTSVLASIPKLDGQITDEAGVLGGDTARVRASLDDLLRTEAVRLWVVLVDTTDDSRAPDVARQLFEQNAMGASDILLVVAVGDHRYGWWESTIGNSDTGTATGLSSREIDALMSAEMEPAFAVGDYAGGIVDLAGGLTRTVREARSRAPAHVTGGATGDDGGPDTIGLLWLMPVLMAGGVVAIIAIAAISGTAGASSGGDSGGVSSGSSGGSSGSAGSANSGSSGGSGSSGSSGGSSGHGGGGGWTDAGGGDSGGTHGGGGW